MGGSWKMVEKRMEIDLCQVRVAFLTLGCKVNSYETEAMERLFVDAGAKLVSFEEEAEIYVVNTCAVTQIADRKSRQMLHRAKKKNPGAIVVAVGCYVQEVGEKLFEDGAVDVCVGNNQKSQVVALTLLALKTRQEGKKDFGSKHSNFQEEGWKEEEKKVSLHNNSMPLAMVDMKRPQPYEDLFITDVSEKTRAYIKIQDGCNQFCSYCIIPYLRGRVRSRNPREVIEEVRQLCEKGYKEIVLTGIHLSSYSFFMDQEPAKDMSLLNNNKSSGEALACLLLDLQKLPKLKRIRLGSLEPRVITKEFVHTIRQIDKLCPHFHLSLQSGCDETLKRMNRKYTTKEYENAVALLREAFDAPAITTDVIVGFPGESDEEFETTYQFLEQMHFAQMHIFRYSIRKGTVAEKLKDQVKEEIKALRSDRLLQLEEQMRKAFEASLLDKEEEILTEDLLTVDGISYRSGHSKRYVRYLLDDSLCENEIVIKKPKDFCFRDRKNSTDY